MLTPTQMQAQLASGRAAQYNSSSSNLSSNANPNKKRSLLILPTEVLNKIFNYIKIKDLFAVRATQLLLHSIINRLNVKNNISIVATNVESSFFVYDDGSIFTCGHNDYGQLGLGDRDSHLKLTRIVDRAFLQKQVVQVAAGEYHTVFVCADGTVFTCGRNDYGQLGLGNKDPQFKPTRIPKALLQKQVVQVAAGERHTFFVCADGTVFTCGINIYGQLGLGDTENRRYPTSVFQKHNAAGKEVIQVAAGERHTVFLCADNTIFTCGHNDYGQLGLGDTENRHYPTCIPKAVFQGKQIIQIAAGEHHTVFLCADGTVFTCGQNDGQLGLGHWKACLQPTLIPNFFFQSDRQIIQIAARFQRTFFVCDDGSVFACGRNEAGQLGLGDTENRCRPTRLPNTVFQEKRVVQVIASQHHTAFVCADGSVFTLGDTCYSRESFDKGNEKKQFLPVQIPASCDNAYEQALTLKSLFLQHILAVNKQNATFNQVMGARVEKILKNTNFFPAIPGILLKALNILNWENYDKTSPEHYKECLLKDITQLTEAQSTKPQFSPLFEAINRKMSEEPYKTAFQRASQWASSASNANEASSSASNTPSSSSAALSSSQHSNRR